MREKCTVKTSMHCRSVAIGECRVKFEIEPTWFVVCCRRTTVVRGSRHRTDDCWAARNVTAGAGCRLCWWTRWKVASASCPLAADDWIRRHLHHLVSVTSSRCCSYSWPAQSSTRPMTLSCSTTRTSPYELTHFAQSSKMGTVTKRFDARLANRPFLASTFWHSGAQGQ